MDDGAAIRARSVRLVVFDVDGVFTDGTLVIDANGVESKTFHVRDGLGVKRLMAAGVGVAVISGRRSPAVALRMRELGVTHVHLGIEDKRGVFDGLCNELGLQPGETAVVGDDLPEIALFEVAGLSIAVADAHADVRARADWTTSLPGGRGAVREIADALIEAGAGT